MNVYNKFTDIFSYLKTILFLAILLTVGTTGAWAQTDYSGIWYIGTVGYNKDKPKDNFYLCPTEGWCSYKATDDLKQAMPIRSLPLINTEPDQKMLAKLCG